MNNCFDEQFGLNNINGNKTSISVTFVDNYLAHCSLNKN